MFFPRQQTYISGLERIQHVSCVQPRQPLKHILVGCKICLTQERYTCWHNQVLKCLAAVIEHKRVTINAIPPSAQTIFQKTKAFIREGEKQRSPSDSSPLNAAGDWEMWVYLNQRLTFPSEIALTNLCPGLVLWSNSCRRVFLVELTVPWEDAIDEAYERKKLHNANLAAEAEERGWRVKVHPVGVGCRGSLASSTARLLKEVGIRGQTQRKTIKKNLPQLPRRAVAGCGSQERRQHGQPKDHLAEKGHKIIAIPPDDEMRWDKLYLYSAITMLSQVTLHLEQVYTTQQFPPRANRQ